MDGAFESSAWGVDGPGRVIGYAGANNNPLVDHPVIWSGGSKTDLPTPVDVLGAHALGTSGDGDVVGYSIGIGSTQPLLWHGDSVTQLPLLSPADLEGVAFSVNDSGQVVGYSQNFITRQPRPDGATAVIWQNGVPTGLGMLPGDTQSVAYGLNQAGTAVGYSQSQTGPARAVAFRDGHVLSLGGLAGDTDSEAFSVNGANEAVGYSAGPSHFHAAAFCMANGVRDLGAAGGDLHSEALAINASGIAVGDSDRDGFTHHAVIYGSGRVLVLDKLTSNLPIGWALGRATGINDSGIIAGEAVDAAGIHHAVKLTPAGPLGLGDVCTAGLASTTGLQADGADAPPADGGTVLAHWDYMVLAGPDGHSDAPNPRGIALAQQAFSRQKLKLWIDPVHHAIPERGVVDAVNPLSLHDTGPCTHCGLASDYDSYFRLKSAYFHPVAPGRWHYALYSNIVCLHPDPNISFVCGQGEGGHADVHGKDFVVAQFSIHERAFRNDLSPLIDGGTFMHELGHTLGLLHGGNEDRNNKINYLSVMNYSYQWGIPFSTRPGSSSLAGWRVDYSGQTLPSLDESHLDERLGLQSGTADLAILSTPVHVGGFFVPTTGPVDYDSDSDATDTDLQLHLYSGDCRSFGDDSSCPHSVLTGFNDWAYLKTSLARDLTVTSRHVGDFPQGGTGSYALTVTNDGSHALSGTSTFVTETPPPGWTITSLSGSGWTCALDHCSRGDSLPAGAAWPAIAVTVNGGPSAASGPNLAIACVADYGNCGVGGFPSDIDGDWTNVLPAPPTLSGFSPSSGQVGSILTLTGTYLAGATTVRFGNDIVTTPSSSTPTSVTVTVPDGAGTGPLTITTPGGTATGTASFTVPVLPTVRSVAPMSGVPGSAVSVQGTGLSGATHICFGTTCVTATVIDNSSATAVVPGVATLLGQTVDVTVVTPVGSSPTNAGDVFTIVAPPIPTVASVSPSSGTADTLVTVAGSGFTGATAVCFGQTCVAAWTVLDDASIAVTVPVSPLEGSMVDVTVSDLSGTSSVSSADLFALQ